MDCISHADVSSRLSYPSPPDGTLPSRRLYQAFLEEGAMVITKGELRKYRLRATIRTQESLEKTAEILQAQGFLRWDSEVEGWRIRKKLREAP